MRTLMLNILYIGVLAVLSGCGPTPYDCTPDCIKPCQYCSSRVMMPQSCIDCHECFRQCEARHGAA